MQKVFTNHLQAVDWIADNSRSEAHFDIMLEDLNFNRIYTGEHFITMSTVKIEMALLAVK